MSEKIPKKLSAAFLKNESFEKVATSLLGKVLVCPQGNAVITELELYTGNDDPASHAFRGKTKRNWPMFESAGRLYTHFIYGMHTCANITIGDEASPAAVLIRSVVLVPEYKKITGPGRVCRELQISLKDNGEDLLNSPKFWLEDWQILVTALKNTQRIGVTKAQEKLRRWEAEIIFSEPV